jgi:hypothetical protein
MFKYAFYALLGISALLIYSWVSLFSLPPEARDARRSYKLNTGVITLLFCAISGLVWYFQKMGNQPAASITLYGFYGVLLLTLLWAISKGRWN